MLNPASETRLRLIAEVKLEIEEARKIGAANVVDMLESALWFITVLKGERQ
jgi:hypothetical protein